MKRAIKSTIAASALAASFSINTAHAIFDGEDPDAPKVKYETKTFCLDTYGPEGAMYVGKCNQVANNKFNKRPLNSNKCADDQVAMTETRNVTAGEKFKIRIKNCEVENDGEIQPTQL